MLDRLKTPLVLILIFAMGWYSGDIRCRNKQQLSPDDTAEGLEKLKEAFWAQEARSSAVDDLYQAKSVELKEFREDQAKLPKTRIVIEGVPYLIKEACIEEDIPKTIAPTINR